MTLTTYTGVLDLAVGAFLLSAVLIVWRRDLSAIVRLLAWQGAALAVLPLIEGLHQREFAPVGQGCLVERGWRVAGEVGLRLHA